MLFQYIVNSFHFAILHHAYACLLNYNSMVVIQPIMRIEESVITRIFNRHFVNSPHMTVAFFSIIAEATGILIEGFPRENNTMVLSTNKSP